MSNLVTGAAPRIPKRWPPRRAGHRLLRDLPGDAALAVWAHSLRLAASSGAPSGAQRRGL